MDHHDENDELTGFEHARFSELPRERTPAADLEERVVRALRRDRTLGAPWYRRTVSVPVAAAAGLVLFALGAAVGRGSPAASGPEQRPTPAADARVIEAPAGGRLVMWM
ncbi:MAG TPA: hypothetical protein VFZ73_11705 [Gemmatimonadaceae bacterium]